MIIAIDPGTTESAYVILEGDEIREHNILPNDTVRGVIKGLRDVDHMAIEMVASYGMPVGETTFETVLWIGRFIEAFGKPVTKVYRKRSGDVPAVGMHLCKSNKAKDANVRQSILDRYPATGGGKTPQVGTKNQPGPLYGIKSHEWQALAVGLTWIDAKANNLV